MTPASPFEVVLSSLVEALRLEKARLLAGDYSDLPKISERKAHYMALLDRHLCDPTQAPKIKPYIEEIEYVKVLAGENTKLLAAAKAGAHAAQKRIAMIKSRENMVGTYTEDGYKLRTHNSDVTREAVV